MLSVRNSCISLCDVENDLETSCLFVGVVFLVVNCALLWNGYLLLFIWACHLHCIWDMVVVRGWCTIFEGRITRRDGYYISSDVSRAAIDALKDMSPMGPRLRDNGCVSLWKTCITIFVIASHGIAHFVNVELEHVFCWSCDCFSVKLVTVKYWVVIENV